MNVTLELNGVDFSDLLSTYDVRRIVEYPRLMTAINGTEYGGMWERTELAFSLRPLTAAESSDLYDILSGGNITVLYTDSYSNSNLTRTMRLTSSLSNVFALKSINGNNYYKGGEITLRQRTVN